ncbi:hypothetical protein [Mesorhizobium sp. M4B.F.Ca.ET.058.02.1.1]|uniref:hypothetical protein n=1 Tax=Mesorhizobium sp. M4B.F.Ca.ET.058.02.1.1 TaxID=2493675 RepID=UPI000F75185F|nr:hypothetical protein [Mesorhizobium sp. M4B.F.Ca.ET.058.02.1.1]AZO48062.1 hypothetical protein EJ073_09715 [Mesorhizobium sp. M4B.F.Ca.ET.058.02.1.1]
MATVLSASNATATSILSTVQTLAITAQRTINTAAAGLDMLDTYVEDARTRQVDASKIARHHYRKNLLLEASIEQARKEQQLTREIGNDQVLSKLFSDNHAELEALFAS